MNKIKVFVIFSILLIILAIMFVMHNKTDIVATKPVLLPTHTDTVAKISQINPDTINTVSNNTFSKPPIQQTIHRVKKEEKKDSVTDTVSKPEEKKVVFTDQDADDLDRILESVTKVTKASAVRANAIQDLEEQIATEEEKVVVQTWQLTTIEKQESKKNQDWAGYHQSLENRISGLWQMGDSGAIAFYKDGTGQVSFIRDDKREQTLTGNFFFRYTIEGNLVQIIPIITKSSNRKITANFVVKLDGSKLQVGPYSYSSMSKKK
jgi:hypothetical protein